MNQVLVVDGDAATGELLRAILGGEPVDLHVATAGKEALERMAHGAYEPLVLVAWLRW